MKRFFDLQRFVEEFYNDSPNQTLNGTKSADYFENSGGIVKIFASGGNDTVKNTGNVITIKSGAGNDSIRNEGGANIKIAGDTGDDTIYSYNVIDGEEDDEDAENISVTGGKGNDSIYSEYGEKITLIGGDGDDTIESYYGDNVKIFGGEGKNYLHSYNSDNVTISAGAGNDIVNSSSSDDVSISSGTGNDSIEISGGENIKVFAGADKDTIYNEAEDVTIEGGKENDLITLSEYYSQKTFIKYAYGDGNDTVIGFGSDDTLQIATNKKFSTVSSGGDLYITFDSGSIVLQDVDTGVGGVGKKNIVTIKGGDDSTDTLTSGLTLNGTTITASKNFKGPTIDLTKYSSVKNLNASAVTQKLKITGNSLDNRIQGGSKNDSIFGGAGNDTLIAGAGKDTLTGGKGKDIFVHSKGKDIITDYTEGEDTIKLNSALKSSEVSGKNVILTTENGTVTIKNGKDKDISLITKISSSTSSLLAENNFMAADNLSAIVENNLSTVDYKISTQNFENLTAENNLLTFAEK